MTKILEGEATIVLMPYKSMMRALYGMGPLAYESCRITVPHTRPRRIAWGRLRAGQIQVASALHRGGGRWGTKLGLSR